MSKHIFPKEVVEFFKNNASCVPSDNGGNYYYYPFWIKVEDKIDVVEVFTFDNLPSELKSLVRDIREEMNDEMRIQDELRDSN